jgi:hypothetical protein
MHITSLMQEAHNYRKQDQLFHMVMHLPCALAAVSEAVQVRFTVSRPSLLYRRNCRSAQLAIRTACRNKQHVRAIMGPCSRDVHPMTRHRSCKREPIQTRSTLSTMTWGFL